MTIRIKLVFVENIFMTFLSYVIFTSHIVQIKQGERPKPPKMPVDFTSHIVQIKLRLFSKVVQDWNALHPT